MLKRFGKKFNYGEQGFTLIELLIVIVILVFWRQWPFPRSPSS